MKRLAWILLMAGCAGSAVRGQAEGIFAEFSTSMGDFTVRLDHERAPRAVASFVGLATGESGWLDAHTNLWRRPLYDGSIFHRVVKDGEGGGIAIQGGGQVSLSVNTNNGVVTTNFTGPGYQMLESVTNGLAHSNGVISMANSGPNTEGSQFFITATHVPGWDGAYSVFGHVVSGMPVVEAIAAVPVQGSGSRPVEDVHLHQVHIRREGPGAETFDIHGQGIPVPEPAPIRVYEAGENLVVEIAVDPQTRPLTLSNTADLQDWWVGPFPWPTNLYVPQGFYSGVSLIHPVTAPLALLGNRHFFHSSRVVYPEPFTSPTNNRARTFTFHWDREPPLVYQATFNSDYSLTGSGWVQDGNSAPYPRVIFVGDTWQRSAYSAQLYFMDDLAREYLYNLGYNPGQATNRFTGFWRPWSGIWQPISGVFTMQ